MRFQNRVALVTGGASGIGWTTATELAREGASVAVADLQTGPVESAAKQVAEAGRPALALTVDVGDRASVQAMVDRTVAQFGRIDVLVTCAGIARRVPLLETTESDWHDVIRVNLTGVFFCGQAVASQMIRQGSGAIVNNASINAYRGVSEMPAYNAAKAGVASLTQTIAVELAAHGIRVNAVAPGPIETPMTANLTPEGRRIRQERVPLDRFGRPEEVAQAILYLASDAASYVTGHTLAVDGGYLAGGTWSRP